MNRSIEELVLLHLFLDYSSWLRKSLELAGFVALNLALDHNFVLLLRFLAVVESLFDCFQWQLKIVPNPNESTNFFWVERRGVEASAH